MHLNNNNNCVLGCSSSSHHQELQEGNSARRRQDQGSRSQDRRQGTIISQFCDGLVAILSQILNSILLGHKIDSRQSVCFLGHRAEGASGEMRRHRALFKTHPPAEGFLRRGKTTLNQGATISQKRSKKSSQFGVFICVPAMKS